MDASDATQFRSGLVRMLPKCVSVFVNGTRANLLSRLSLSRLQRGLGVLNNAGAMCQDAKGNINEYHKFH